MKKSTIVCLLVQAFSPPYLFSLYGKSILNTWFLNFPVCWVPHSIFPIGAQNSWSWMLLLRYPKEFFVVLYPAGSKVGSSQALQQKKEKGHDQGSVAVLYHTRDVLGCTHNAAGKPPPFHSCLRVRRSGCGVHPQHRAFTWPLAWALLPLRARELAVLTHRTNATIKHSLVL